MTLTVSTDKKAYAPGDRVTATVTSDGTAAPFTVTVTAQAGAQTATTAYTVQPGVLVSDNHGGTWTYTPATVAGTAVFAGTAPAAPAVAPPVAPPAVPGGFGGTEPPVTSAPGAFTWMGYTWEPQNWGTTPGGPAASQVTVNAAGELVLTASTVNGNYRGGEADSARGDRGIAGNVSTWGYGTYTWVIGTDLSALPAGLVLGLFTFWAASKGGPAGQKEIDIEVGTFGLSVPPLLQLGFYADTAATITAAVPPLHTLVPGSQVAAKSAPVTTVRFTWLPASITWDVWYGTVTAGLPDYTLTMTQGQEYAYTQPFGGNAFAGTVNIPAAGGQQVIMNLWTTGNVALPGTAEVVLRSFSYTPVAGAPVR